MRTYTQLTLEPRYQIEALLKTRHPYQKIVHVVGVHKSIMRREIRRNQGMRGYIPLNKPSALPWPGAAPKKSDGVFPPARGTLSIACCRKSGVRNRLVDGCACARATPSAKNGSTNSHHDKRAHGTLFRHLRCPRQRRKRYRTNGGRGHLSNRISIEQRPAIVENRTRLGDGELDTMWVRATIKRGFHYRSVNPG